MAGTVSGRVTGIAVDPSDPSSPSQLFHFNLDLLAERREDDRSLPDDTFDFKTASGGEDNTSSAGWPDGFTGGVYVATNAADLPLTDTSLPAVQFDPALDGFATAQPFAPGHDLSYSNSFSCIPDGVLL
jgi:hypothetical protein